MMLIANNQSRNGIFREYYETCRQTDSNKSSEVEILIKENDEKILLEAEQPWNIFEDELDLPCLLPDYQHGVHEKYATVDGAHVDIHET